MAPDSKERAKTPPVGDVVYSDQSAPAGSNEFIIDKDDLILLTGAGGFIGSRVVQTLLNLGFTNLRCFARPSSKQARMNALSQLARNGVRIETMKGNLLSPEDCAAAAKDAKVIFHLAAGRGEKSYPGCVQQLRGDYSESARGNSASQLFEALREHQLVLGLFQPRENRRQTSRRVESYGAVTRASRRSLLLREG